MLRYGKTFLEWRNELKASRVEAAANSAGKDLEEAGICKLQAESAIAAEPGDTSKIAETNGPAPGASVEKRGKAS